MPTQVTEREKAFVTEMAKLDPRVRGSVTILSVVNKVYGAIDPDLAAEMAEIVTEALFEIGVEPGEILQAMDIGASPLGQAPEPPPPMRTLPDWDL